MSRKIFILFFSILVFTNSACTVENQKDTYKHRRYNMVDKQLQLRGIKDEKVLKAMLDVPRHLFVPDEYIDDAYGDFPLPIGYGQTISQPFIVALMTELLKLNKDSKVLEVGTGSGYQAAVLAQIVKQVYTIEIIEGLYKRSTKLLKSLKYNNIKTKLGDGYAGWEQYAPFDAIIVTCAAEAVPRPLIEQLNINGRICIPVGEAYSVQDLIVLKKTSKNEMQREIITKVRFVPLIRQKGQ
ncbi:protein-L-isoaspartate(D-aspartate) O-methyltransferase [bacterium]